MIITQQRKYVCIVAWFNNHIKILQEQNKPKLIKYCSVRLIINEQHFIQLTGMLLNQLQAQTKEFQEHLNK